MALCPGGGALPYVTISALSTNIGPAIANYTISFDLVGHINKHSYSQIMYFFKLFFKMHWRCFFLSHSVMHSKAVYDPYTKGHRSNIGRNARPPNVIVIVMARATRSRPVRHTLHTSDILNVL